MHDYSIDTQIRRYVHTGIAVISLSLPAVVSNLAAQIGVPFAITFPLSFGATLALFFILFDRFVWRWFSWLHKVPNLEGIWIAEGESSYEDPDAGENYQFTMEVRIRQTFSRIEVFTETDQSTSRSFMASIEIQHAVPIFRYGFENTPKSMADEELQRHGGMMDLRISDNETLEGDYFSGKHRLRFGALKLTRSNNGNK